MNLLDRHMTALWALPTMEQAAGDHRLSDIMGLDAWLGARGKRLLLVVNGDLSAENALAQIPVQRSVTVVAPLRYAGAFAKFTVEGRAGDRSLWLDFEAGLFIFHQGGGAFAADSPGVVLGRRSA